MKFTFKIHRETGLASMCYSPTCDIKLNKNLVGFICVDRVTNKYKVWFHVVNDDDIGWKNKKLKANFDSIEEAKAFIKKYESQILEQYKLKQIS
jgi:hypothetical protein